MQLKGVLVYPLLAYGLGVAVDAPQPNGRVFVVLQFSDLPQKLADGKNGAPDLPAFFLFFSIFIHCLIII